MPQDPSARQKTQEALEQWILKPHELQLQFYVQKFVLPLMKEAAGVTDCAIQFRCNGERKFLLWVDKEVKIFDAPKDVVDWLAEVQKQRELKEQAALKKAS